MRLIYGEGIKDIKKRCMKEINQPAYSGTISFAHFKI